jgi:uncharacterized membrane protein
MHKGRLEAFSDGVVAILITIMVLELRPPQADTTWSGIAHMRSEFLAYILSFVFLGIYWNNHHHMLHATRRVNGTILWANLHLLFWLSLVPFTTAWMGRNPEAPFPNALYGFVLLCCAIAYTILQRVILKEQGQDSKLAQAVGNDAKGHLSLLLYISAIPIAFVHPFISDVIYVIVALIWIVPDRRIEAVLAGGE